MFNNILLVSLIAFVRSLFGRYRTKNEFRKN